jgi:hypothetical protein
LPNRTPRRRTPFTRRNAGGEFRTEETGISGLVRDTPNRSQPEVDPPLNWLTMADQPIPYGPSLLLANRHIRDILRLKGYEVHYAEFSGGHNALSWRGTFADALIALIGLTPKP